MRSFGETRRAKGGDKPQFVGPSLFPKEPALWRRRLQHRRTAQLRNNIIFEKFAERNGSPVFSLVWGDAHDF